MSNLFLRQDAAYALRLIRRNPGFALAALLAIALGVGGTAAVFSVVHGVLLRPLPYPDADRIIAVAEEHPGATTAFSRVLLTNLTYEAWGPNARTIVALGAYSNRPATLTGSDQPQRLRGTAVTPSLFSMLGLAPAAGRLLVDGDAVEGGAPVVVLGYGYWQGRFGGDPGAIGGILTLDGQPHEIVGVAPRGFAFPGPSPIDLYSVQRVPAPDGTSRTVTFMNVLARLAPGATPEQAAAEATAVARTVERPRVVTLLFGEGGPVEVRAERLLDRMTSRIRPALLLLSAGIALVLLIACANLANLFLSRTASRSRELAVRAALGAGRGRLLSQLLTESLFIALAGAALGIGIAWALIALVPAIAPSDFPRLEGIRMDLRVLGVALAASILVGLAAGILPALRGSAGGLMAAMRAGDPRATGVHGGATRALLIGGEAALAVMLLVGAVLLGRSFEALVRVDPGYDPDRVLLGTLHFTGVAGEKGRGPAALAHILERVRDHPAVLAAGAGNMPPFSAGSALSGFSIPGLTGADGQPLMARALSHRVTTGYAEALGMRLRQGRWFHEADATAGIMPLIVNEAFASTYLTDGRPTVGRRFEGLFGFNVVEIVGLAGNVLPARLDGQAEPQIYFPVPPDIAIPQMTLAVRADEVAAFAPALRSIVHDTEPGVAVEVVPLANRIAESVGQPRFAASVLGAFAVLALALAATGLYGVLSYTVSLRRRELSVRAALGAGRGRLIGLVLRQGLGLTAAGLLAGMAGAFATSRLMSGLLFGVSPIDPVSFAAAPLVLTLVAIAACVVPARRAAAADPIEALKAE